MCRSSLVLMTGASSQVQPERRSAHRLAGFAHSGCALENPQNQKYTVYMACAVALSAKGLSESQTWIPHTLSPLSSSGARFDTNKHKLRYHAAGQQGRLAMSVAPMVALWGLRSLT